MLFQTGLDFQTWYLTFDIHGYKKSRRKNAGGSSHSNVIHLTPVSPQKKERTNSLKIQHDFDLPLSFIIFESWEINLMN